MQYNVIYMYLFIFIIYLFPALSAKKLFQNAFYCYLQTLEIEPLGFAFLSNMAKRF